MEQGTKRGDYYLGLDMGTDSVGWAVTDMDYRIPKFKGNAMWGVRLFDESNTAEERGCFASVGGVPSGVGSGWIC